MHFRKRNENQSCYTFKSLDGTKLNYTTSYKYLGVIFDEHLEMDMPVKTLTQSAG